MTPPELNPQEQRELDKVVDLEIQDWVEKKHLTEVPLGCLEGLCDPDL